MRLGRAASILPTISAFVSTCQCLPVIDQRLAPSPELAARATYSVVPIDGGSGQGGSSPGGSGGSDSGSGAGSGPGLGPPPTGTVTVTVVATLPPKTSFRTVYVASPPTTERLVETFIVTKTIHIVDVASPGSTTTTTTASDINTRTVSTTSAETGSQTTSIAVSSDSATTSQTVTLFTSAATPVPTALSSSTTTYDDGQWHTSYPAWNGTLPRRGSGSRLRPRLAV